MRAIYHFLKNLLRLYRYRAYKSMCVSGENLRIGDTGLIAGDNNTPSNIRIGNNVAIDGNVASQNNCTGVIEIGDYSYIGANTRVWAYKRISIGKHVAISHNCNVFDSNSHAVDYLERQNAHIEFFHTNKYVEKNVSCKDVVIEDNVWIGANSCIMKGVHIGARSIIGAGSVVVHSIPADCVAAGNPAKVIKKLNDKEEKYEECNSTNN